MHLFVFLVLTCLSRSRDQPERPEPAVLPHHLPPGGRGEPGGPERPPVPEERHGCTAARREDDPASR